MNKEENEKESGGVSLGRFVIGVLFWTTILVGLVLGVFTLIKKNEANKIPQVLDTALRLENAITLYEIEYNRYPLAGQSGDTTIDSDRETMKTLTGTESADATSFFSGSGIPENTPLLDPWGTPFRIRMDTNRDRSLQNPELPSTVIQQAVIVWSAGKDRDFSTWQDNIRSW